MIQLFANYVNICVYILLQICVYVSIFEYFGGHR